MKVVNSDGTLDKRTYFGRRIRVTKRDWEIYFAWAYSDNTIASIGRDFGLTSERIRQIVTRIEYLVATKRIEIPSEPKETFNG